MKRLFGSLFLVFTLCVTVAAQKDDAAKKDAADKIRAQQSAASPPINIGDHARKQDQTGSNATKFGDYVLSDDMKFAVKDGAVYFNMPGSGILMPMSGGGASGCLTSDLPQRIDRLRIYIEKLQQEKPPAVRQTETYAM